MHSIDDLVLLMQRLRDPDTGCPWDLKQSYETIIPHTLEEAYEVADAIERGNKQDLKDELGDLLFQVIFYAQLGREESEFDFNDVVDNVVKKLLRRHPHVFPDGTLQSARSAQEEPSETDIKSNWERIKAEERASKPDISRDNFESVLDTVPSNFPALQRAEKLQKKASQVGFDWEELAQVFDKIQEELDELKEIIAMQGSGEICDPAEIAAKMEHEMGDVLFACVNLSRFVKVNSEKALRGTNQRFTSRFQFVEKMALEQGRALNEMALGEMDALWDEAKRIEKEQS